MKKMLGHVLLSFLFIVITGEYSFTEQIDRSYILNFDKFEQCTLYVRDVKSFTVNNPKRAAINNPEIADISSVSENEILITAKSPGATVLTWTDDLGEHSINLNVILENISFVKKQVDNLLKMLELPNVYTKEAADESKIVLLGTVQSEEKMDRMNKLLDTYREKIINLVDMKEGEESIQIEAKILEVRTDSAKNLGIEWPTGTLATEPSGRWDKLGGIPDAFYRVSEWSRAAFNTTVNFLIQNGSARILSQPHLVCQSGKEATLLVGGEVPILTTQVSSSGDSGTSVEYKEYGIKLAISPLITETGEIKLSLQIEVSDIEAAVILGTTDQPTAKAYPLTKRTTSTELFLNDGQTLIIGGLIKQKDQETLKKVPFLSNIPLLGAFFRSSETTEGGGAGNLADLELVISLTPTLLSKKSSSGKQQTYSADYTEKISSSGSNTGVGDKLFLDIYSQEISQKIIDNFEYPPEAKKSSLEGSVELALLLSPEGKILDAKIMKSSGYDILDETALETANRIINYPPFPPEIKETKLWVNIPIIYNLN